MFIEYKENYLNKGTIILRQEV